MKRARLSIGLASLTVFALFLAIPMQASAATYPTHSNIISTTFWVGEIFNANAADGSQVCSTYDGQWALNWSGVDNGSKAGSGTDCAGAPLGGCDGQPSGFGSAFKCATEKRTAGNGFFPTSSAVHPKQNPFYLDLPFDDVNNSAAYRARGTVVPWANTSGYAGNATNQNFSYMKNRWVKITKGSATCYGQVEDAGPGGYNDQAYVFGSAKPASRQFNNAGMDVSPALNGCLGYAELDGENDSVNWAFVDGADVPAGAWTKVVTYAQVENSQGSPAYIASITPGGVTSTTASTTATATTATTATTTATATRTTATTTPSCGP